MEEHRKAEERSQKMTEEVNKLKSRKEHNNEVEELTKVKTKEELQALINTANINIEKLKNEFQKLNDNLKVDKTNVAKNIEDLAFKQNFKALVNETYKLEKFQEALAKKKPK